MRTIPASIYPRKDGLRFSAPLRDTPRQFKPESRWFRSTLPADDQGNEPSCGGRWGGWTEMMIMAYCPPRRLYELLDKIDAKAAWQIDSRRIWAHARELYYGGDMTGGLQMEDGFNAEKMLGWLPSTAKLVRVPTDPGELAHQLTKTPICQGTATHDGWGEPSKLNGQIPLHYLPNPYAGHFTVIVGALAQAKSNFITFQNSWGMTWGRFGYGTLRWDQWLQMLLDDPMTAEVDPEWWAEGMWAEGVIKP